jgi:hypothetical protein
LPALNADITNNSGTCTRIPERSRTSERATPSGGGPLREELLESVGDGREHRDSSPDPWKQQRESSEQSLNNS